MRRRARWVVMVMALALTGCQGVGPASKTDYGREPWRAQPGWRAQSHHYGHR